MGFPSFLGAFFLVSHLLVLHSSSSCPSSFNCGKLAPLKFPFTNNTHPQCGWFNVSCDELVPRVKLSPEGRSYQITGFSDHTISLKDPLLETKIKSKDCEFSGYMNPLNTPHMHHVSFTIFPNLTLFKCVTNDKLEQETKKRFPNNNYTDYRGGSRTCHVYTVYYSYPNQPGDQVPNRQGDQVPTPGRIPENCVFFQLPVRSSVKGRNLSDPFSLLTPNFSVEYLLSKECRECRDDGGQFQHYFGKFQCKRRGRKRLPLILGGELGPISKTQNSQARESACEEILAQAVRHAPTLLDYDPSYKGVLKKKEKKKKDGEPREKGKRKESSQPTTKHSRKRKTLAPSTADSQPKRQRGVKLPKIGYTAEEWLTPIGAEPSTEEMSRRSIPRPQIPTKPLNPARAQTPAELPAELPREKKRKTSQDLSAPSISKPIQQVDSATDPRERELLANPHIDLTNPEVEAAILRPFSPSYAMPSGRVLMLKDSVKEEPNLAVTLLRGLALPRDCEQVPSDLMPSLAEMCSHLVQAGQAAQKAYDKAEKVQAEKERFRFDRDSFKAKWRASVREVKEAETEIELLKKELADSRAVASSAEEKVKKLQGEETEKLKEADLKGYSAGINRAALEYTRTSYKMVNEALEGQLPDFYRRGYAEGANQMAGVMVIQAESGFLKQLPEPVIPDLDLPYTEEDCAPLPPESEGEEDMAEASQKDDPAEADDQVKDAEADGKGEVAAAQDP